MSFGEDLDKLVEENMSGLVGKHHSWGRVRLKDVAQIANGFAYKSAHFHETQGTPLIRIRDILKGNPGSFYNAPVDDPKMTFVSSGEIVVGMDGDFNSTIWAAGKALVNQRVCTLKADEALFLQKLLAFALPGYLKLINDHTSSVTVKHLSSKTVQDIPLPLAPLNEQRLIVEKIETLFAGLDKGEEALRRVQVLLKQYRQSILKAAVTGELTREWRDARKGQLENGQNLLARILQTRRENWQGRGKYKEPVEPNTDDLPDFPDGWVWASVDQLSCVVDYGSSAKCSDDAAGIPVLRMGNIFEGHLALTSLKYLPNEHDEFPKLLLQKGDLLFNRTNSAELVGKTAVYQDEFQACSFASYLIRVKLISVVPELVSSYINSLFGRDWVKSVVSQQVGQANVNGTKLKALAVPLAPLREQRRILDELSDATSKISTLERWCETELKRSASLRQSILKDAFAGKLVPQDPNDEPASELLARIKAKKAVKEIKPKTKRKKRA